MSFADLDVSPDRPAYYTGSRGGDGDSDDHAARIDFTYVPGGATEPRTDRVASHGADGQLGWTDADGVQATAQAVLRHFTGEEPDQALLEALTMAKGDEWTAAATWTLDVDELRAIV